MLSDFDRATKGGFYRNSGLYTAEQLQTMIDLLGAIQGEQYLSPAQAKAFENFRDQLNRLLTIQQQAEQREAEEAAAKKAKSAEQSRRWSTKFRERPMSPRVESLRFRELTQIVEDYGLNSPNPDPTQIWAGLLAAFRTGARQFHQVSNELLHNGEQEIDWESWGKRFAQDEAKFEQARGKAKEAEK